MVALVCLTGGAHHEEVLDQFSRFNWNAAIEGEAKIVRKIRSFQNRSVH